MSRTCGTCGALTGAMMGLSAVLGRSRPDESVDRVYDATQQLIRRFEAEFGSRNCHELLGCDLGSPEGQATFKKEQLREGCIKIAGRAAEMAGEIVSEKQGSEK
jgi:C_GCAxxG_C_C family probable redox protein